MILITIDIKRTDERLIRENEEPAAQVRHSFPSDPSFHWNQKRLSAYYDVVCGNEHDIRGKDRDRNSDQAVLVPVLSSQSSVLRLNLGIEKRVPRPPSIHPFYFLSENRTPDFHLIPAAPKKEHHSVSFPFNRVQRLTGRSPARAGLLLSSGTRLVSSVARA